MRLNQDYHFKKIFVIEINNVINTILQNVIMEIVKNIHIMMNYYVKYIMKNIMIYVQLENVILKKYIKVANVKNIYYKCILYSFIFFYI